MSDLQLYSPKPDLQLIETGDGSHSLYSIQFDETYHSRHGAISEARHIYLNQGLIPLAQEKKLIRIFETGIGTGLLAALTADVQQQSDFEIEFHSVEKFPIEKEIWSQLNFVQSVDPYFSEINELSWESEHNPWPGFHIKKIQGDLMTDNLPENYYDLIFFNPFAPNQQPEMWDLPFLKKMFQILVSGGQLVTYSSKSSFRHHLTEAGFQVHKLPGPLGKREMVKAVKP